MSDHHEVRRANEGIRWPRRELCEAARKGDGPECLCRLYDGLDGYYVIARSAGSDGNGTGHARAYFLARRDAVSAARAYDSLSQAGALQDVPCPEVPGAPPERAVTTPTEATASPGPLFASAVPCPPGDPR